MTSILIMAGGTGGHIFPALATAEILRQRDVHVEWLGTRKGMEAKLVPAHDFAINFIDISGLRGKGIKTILLLPFKLLRAMYQTMQVYKKVQPDVVLGMGGFVTGPGGIVGWLTGRPLVLHEQNAIAGMTNKILLRFAKSVLAAFPGAFGDKANAVRVIGNPVRKEITALATPEVRFENKSSNKAGMNILIVGGSLGATALNEKIPEALIKIQNEGLLEQSAFDSIYVRHQCGEKNVSETEKNYTELSSDTITVEVMPFIDDMAKNYAWADLIICRSGALTVSEIAAAGVASLLVPYPYAVDDHQTANAAYLADQGAAFLVQQDNLAIETLVDILMTLDKKKLLSMAIKARELSIDNAAEVVADECMRLAGQA
ncbi:undecaprenyldiphospho-muramoylpentapeptide beta-N-acetylglucosaminyltransferase [sulfur-oxidizing endosymbiont of Gigantopelta aegis]|uniref:undecaprenyldiphospho-muramoylpentapeptide beta-N-acetylglucosaminyltransferase n=1 Tax=sulfur-oxidizing endosymbiont of Gigantopelta aegis TaxID=2794934 RepID=UPI0018DC5B2D|nr:undecaprenyldiphospho-muramoylpentapeptide beta-N-acetylglucosaminyltransferase [sulfur-oxidizing endosymbiont of Gigantopelta aegis]